jgi:hypothetical protein
MIHSNQFVILDPFFEIGGFVLEDGANRQFILLGPK